MPLDDPIPDATRGAPLRQLARTVTPTGRARPFTRDELIVSKTDAKGVITYANDVFLRVAEISEHEALSAPHSLIRHPDMPRCMFKLLWDRIAAKQKIFAYVLNLSRSGDHYWVFAHVTPSLDGRGAITGYHSNRRAPSERATLAAADLYRALKAEEDGTSDKSAGMALGMAMLNAVLAERGISYD